MVFHEWGSHASPKLAEWMGNTRKNTVDVLRFHFWGETYWAQQVFKINVSSVLVTFSAWCCLGARYPQCDLKWGGLVLFWLSVSGSQGHAGFCSYLGDLEITGCMWWQAWWPELNSVLKPFKTGIALPLPPSLFSLHLCSTHPRVPRAPLSRASRGPKGECLGGRKW